ncbi:ABC transporter permease [Saccharospirillum mangrovi]|uniref:ABC transporter permease n=1 Tax=Saccharospirillum mangrovi TaxID=2161747 RepID=UPI000D387FEE|nr:iron export ABC transporter permease subunit FetB [Saccharospirillum mangrovi]
MNVIDLSVWQLCLVAALLLVLAATLWAARLGVSGSLVVAALRTAVQLSLIGLVLEALFAVGALLWVALLALGMLVIAGREVWVRQSRPLTGGWGFGIGTLSMFISAFSVTILMLAVVIRPDPWYQPQYAIPLLGMLLGNTMNSVTLALDRLTESAWRQRAVIEARLMLGEKAPQALSDIRRAAVRSGLIPVINAMAAAGVVSVPGMMTGQILAGSAPSLAVKYQIMIMFGITLGSGFGTLFAVNLASRRLFDARQRLRLDRLRSSRG